MREQKIWLRRNLRASSLSKMMLAPVTSPLTTLDYWTIRQCCDSRPWSVDLKSEGKISREAF